MKLAPRINNISTKLRVHVLAGQGGAEHMGCVSQAGRAEVRVTPLGSKMALRPSLLQDGVSWDEFGSKMEAVGTMFWGWR